MVGNISTALLITLIGMGLVFSTILLLWALMAVLVKLVSKDGDATDSSDDQAGIEILRKRRAASAAVAIALAQLADQTELHEFPLPPTALVSAWQAVMRTKMHTKRGSTK